MFPLARVRSPLGVFSRSALDIQRRAYPTPLVGGMWQPLQRMCMVFVDDSPGYSSAGDSWNGDIAIWNYLLALADSPLFGAGVCDVDGGTIIPDGESVPTGITYQTMSRSPALAEFVAAYEATVKDPPLLDGLILFLNTSRSMTRAALEPGIDDFETWLDNGGTENPDPDNPLPPIPWMETPFYDALWVRRLFCGVYLYRLW